MALTFAGTPGCADGVSVGCGDGVAIAFGGGSGGVAIWVLAVSTATAAVATGPSLLAGVGAALTSTRDDADSSLAALTGDMCALAGAAMAASLVSSPFTHGSTTSSRPTASSAQPEGGMTCCVCLVDSTAYTHHHHQHRSITIACHQPSG